MKALFVSENKEDWETLTNILKVSYSKIQLVCTKNVEDAMAAAATDGPFGFFILDCNMREVEPDGLGLNLIEFTGPRPILFLGHEAVITDRISQQLFQSNEFNERLLRPLDRDNFLEELQSSVDKIILWAKEEEFEQSLEQIDPNEYLPMKLKSFYLYSTFPYDIYLSITKSTYIKLLSANKTYSHSTLANYAKKNIKFLHIKKDDQLKYLEKEATKCLKALKVMDAKNKDIYLLQLRSITVLHQYMLAIGVTPSVLTLANATTESIIMNCLAKPSLTEIFSEYPVFYEGVASKSLLTAYIAEAIGKKLEWESETTKRKLGMCAILQDLTLPEESMSKINSARSPELKRYKEKEVEAYLQHPITAANYAKQFTSYPDIDYIIEAHHELPNRKGFPNRPISSNLTQINSVFNMAQYIASEIDGEDISNNLLSKVLKSMNRDYNTGVFKEIYKLLRPVLKMRSKP